MKQGKTLKRISALLMAFLLLPVFTVAQEPQNASLTVPNGNFEKGKEEWEMRLSTDYYEIVEEDGNSFLRIKKKTSVFSSPLDVPVGETFVWIFDMRSAETMSVTIRFLNENDEKVKDVRQYCPLSPNAWATYKAIATAPENTHSMQLMLSADKDMVVDYDNVRVEKLEAPSGDIVENGNMETLAENNLPKNFTIQGEGCTVTETAGHSGKALKISTNDETAEVTVGTAWIALKAGEKYDLSAYMNLTELTEGSNGVCLELYKIASPLSSRTRETGTSYFKAITYEDGTKMGWRKMMIPRSSLSASGLYELRVTFKGKGTVYLDDFAAVTTNDIVRNGDFEGFSADFTPAGKWNHVGDWGEAKIQCILKDTDGNHYLRVGNGTADGGSTNTGINCSVSLQSGIRYVAEMDGRGADWKCKMHLNKGTSSIFNYDRTGKSENNGTEWTRDYSYFFTLAEGGDCAFALGCRDAKGYACIDNVSIAAVSTEDTLEISQTDENVTATFTGFGTDYADDTKNRTVSVVLARYLVTGDPFKGFKTTLDAFEILEGQAAKIAWTATNYTTTTQFGEVPLVLPVTMEKADAPSGASYKYKAFAVDASNRLLPYVHAEDLTY